MSRKTALPPKRILQIAHGHPSFHPGGTEVAALALHSQALAAGLDSWYLGALENARRLVAQGTNMVALSADSRESALYAEDFHWFELSQDDRHGFLSELRDYLGTVRPDVVHMHHVIDFGLESLHVVRQVVPDARIVLTLHDYFLICANDGKLFKHPTRERCPGPSLQGCLECFPDRDAADFKMRELDISRAISLVDVVVSPSEFLKRTCERHLKGAPDIHVVENGYLGADVASAPAVATTGGEVTFGYFGNISAVKGLSDLLDAADILSAAGVGGFSISVHGSQLMDDPLLAERILKAKAALGSRLRLLGRYQPEEMGALMADIDVVVFPSIWWENAPLVVYEAIHHQRQVIAYPHGGAPEILARHAWGLLADRSDATALADAMAKVIHGQATVAMRTPAGFPGRRDLLARYRDLYFSQ